MEIKLYGIENRMDANAIKEGETHQKIIYKIYPQLSEKGKI